MAVIHMGDWGKGGGGGGRRGGGGRGATGLTAQVAKAGLSVDAINAATGPQLIAVTPPTSGKTTTPTLTLTPALTPTAAPLKSITVGDISKSTPSSTTTATVPSSSTTTATTGERSLYNIRSGVADPASFVQASGGTSGQIAATIVSPSSGPWTGAAAAHRAHMLEADMEAEEADAEDDDEDMGGWGFVPIAAVPLAAAAAAPIAAPVAAAAGVGGGLYALLNRKGKLKRRKKQRARLLHKLEAAKATGNEKKIARVQKKLAKKKAKVLKVAARRMAHGKSLSLGERRILAHENEKIHARKVRAHVVRGLTYVPRPASLPEYMAAAHAYEQTARMSDEDVAAAMDTSPGALKATAATASAVDAAEADEGASGGLFGLSWLTLGMIALGVAGGGYLVSKGLKKKPGGGYSFEAKAIAPAVKADVKKMGAAS